MRYLLSIFVLTFSLSASTYYAKVEPYRVYSIKSTVSGEVISVFNELEGRVSNGEVLIEIDSTLNKKELTSSKEKLASLKRTVELVGKNLRNSKEVERIREESYERIKNLKTKSRTSKDAELVNLINASNQVLSLENSLENLKVSISDLEFKIASLEDSIKRKSISIDKGFFVYKIHINRGDFVNAGTLLVDAYDISKGKLTIFLSREDVEDAKSKMIYINDKKSNFKIDKIWKVADTQNISSYRAEIIIAAPKRFSELLKIELK